jgi:hippurate hydrolase
VLIGNGVEDGGCRVRNPGDDCNDRKIGVGSAYWMLLADRFLAAAP